MLLAFGLVSIESAKGPHVIPVRDWVDTRLGPGSFFNLAKALEPSWPEHLVILNWYPVRPMISALKSALREGETLQDIVSEISSAHVKVDLSTTHKAFSWVSGPSQMFKMGEVIWGNYSNSGRFEGVTNEPGLFVADCRDIAEDLLEWASGTWLGFLPTAVAATGGQNPTVTAALHRAGDRSHFRCECRYDPPTT